MNANGSSDSLRYREFLDRCDLLRNRLEFWEPSIGRQQRYDDAVKALIVACLDEVKPEEDHIRKELPNL